MKSQSLHWRHLQEAPWLWLSLPSDSLNGFHHVVVKSLIAAIPALGLLVITAWAIAAPGTAEIGQAVAWTSGFIFLTLAMESGGQDHFRWLLASGILLPALAVLSSRVAGEFLVIAAAVVAAWSVYKIVVKSGKHG